MALAVASIALTFSCTGNKTAQDASENDSTKVADSVSAANNELDLATVAGTYEGVLPAADSPGIKTVLTINTDKETGAMEYTFFYIAHCLLYR